MMAATLRNTLLGAAAVVLAGAAVGLLYFRQPQMAASAAKVEAAASPVPAAVQTDSPAARDPAVSDSDPIMLEGMRVLIGAVAANQYLEPRDIVRRIVTSVDNLPRTHVARAQLPVRAQIGGFIATSDDEQRTPLSAENFARYAPYVQLLSALDVRALAQLYATHSAWFQQAYDELNHADAPPSFRARLTQAIDTLLATPEPSGPLLIYRPEASYEFADPDFESLPVGEKLLLRMGPANAALVKGKLRELKAALATLPP
jgi:hypothetical protein